MSADCFRQLINGLHLIFGLGLLGEALHDGVVAELHAWSCKQIVVLASLGASADHGIDVSKCSRCHCLSGCLPFNLSCLAVCSEVCSNGCLLLRKELKAAEA